MPDNKRFYAVLIDIMGFAAEIEAMTEQEHDDLDAMLLSPANGPGLADRAVRFASSYQLFHQHIGKLAWQSHLFIHSLMTFSDSAYLVTPELRIAEGFAMSMVRECYTWRIPVRVGIGYGNFARLAFSTLIRPSGALIADSPFLGSSIIRAYRANACCARGFRIFLHPSVLKSCGPAWQYDDLPDFEKSPEANRELNFLHPPYQTAEAALSSIHDMRLGVTSPRALKHYDASVPAIRRLDEIGTAAGWSFSSQPTSEGPAADA